MNRLSTMVFNGLTMNVLSGHKRDITANQRSIHTYIVCETSTCLKRKQRLTERSK